MIDTADQPTTTEMEKIGYEIMEDLGDTYWWYRARREITAELIARFVPAGGRIIDVGSGDGATAALLHDRGFRVAAADISPFALDGCRRRGIDAIDLRTNPLPSEAAECVILGDVLEHVPEDFALLAEARKALVPTGVVVVTVPAYEFLWSGEDHVSRHYRRYRLPQLTAALQKGGFDLTWASYYNTFLLPVIVTVLLAKRIFRPRDMYKSDVTPLSNGLNEVLYRVFRAEAPVLRHITFPFGASIVAVAVPKKSLI